VCFVGELGTSRRKVRTRERGGRAVDIRGHE
jgi:hypothetical protein